MTTRLLLSALAALTLAAPAFAQSSGSDGSGPDAPAAARPDGSGDQAAAPKGPTAAPGRGAGAADGSSDGRLYIRLDEGGEVIFKPVEGAAGPAKRAKRVRYKGYAKKGLAKYKKAAEDKRLDKGAVESLDAGKAQKAQELAAEAEMNADVQKTIGEKMKTAQDSAGESDEKDKLAAAADSAKATDRRLKRQMKDFEDKEAGGKTIFKEPAAEPSSDRPHGGDQETPGETPVQPAGEPRR